MTHAITSAQIQNSNSTIIIKKIPITTDLFLFNKFSIVPNSFMVINVPDSLYKIDEINATIRWLQKPNQDSVFIKFRTLNIMLNKKYQHLNYEDVRYRFVSDQSSIIKNNEDQNTNSIFNLKGLSSEGSFGRSLSFGNNQDAVLSSSMNFQISGFIGDSLQLTAAISDNNIPIQPDGNTKDLRDFDRIFLQLKKKKWQVSFGDLDINEKEKYFLKFNRRIQGVSFSTENKISDISTNHILMRTLRLAQ